MPKGTIFMDRSSDQLGTMSFELENMYGTGGPDFPILSVRTDVVLRAFVERGKEKPSVYALSLVRAAGQLHSPIQRVVARFHQDIAEVTLDPNSTVPAQVTFEIPLDLVTLARIERERAGADLQVQLTFKWSFAASFRAVLMGLDSAFRVLNGLTRCYLHSATEGWSSWKFATEEALLPKNFQNRCKKFNKLRRRYSKATGKSASDTVATRNHRSLTTSEMATHELIATADQFLWDGTLRSRAEMEELLAQNERGLAPGCGECDRLEKGLVAARDRDRKEKNLEMRSESPALRSLQEHRRTH